MVISFISYSNISILFFFLEKKKMINIHRFLFLTAIMISQAFTNIIYLENCTYTIDLYKEYLNLLWSSNDSRSLHIQAVYSLSLNQSSSSSSIPGHIYTYSSRSVALIPFFLQCKSFSNLSYLPFTQCSSTITNIFSKKNYESTRTHLNLQTILSMPKVPLLYLGEYQLILFNCSFQSNSTIYQLKSTEIFSFRIEYESSILSDCYSCNRRTSICYEKTCRCRSGSIPLNLYINKQYCVDITRNCTLDFQRCLYTKYSDKNYSNELLFILIILISFILVLLLSLFWCLYRTNSSEMKKKYDFNEHERTPSTISTIDSIKLTIENQYPKIIGEENNGEIVYILV